MANDKHWRDRPNEIRVIDDEKKQALLLNDFKLDVPEEGIFDAPYSCYLVNQEWGKIIFGLVSWLSTVAVWKDAKDDTHDGIQGILEFLSQDGLCMGLFKLRQKETDPCILEQSIDGGENWSTAFNYQLCDFAGNNAMLETATGELAVIRTNWDETIQSVAPDMVYGSSQDDDDMRDLILCHALESTVWIACNFERNRRESFFWGGFIIGSIITAVGVAVMVATGGLGTPLVLALVGVFTAGNAVGLAGLSDDLLNNRDAQNSVACCMYHYLKHVTPTQLSFEGSLDDCDFPLLSNESQLAGAIAEILTEPEIYETFLDLMQYLWDNKDWFPFECGCSLPWSSTLDLTLSSYGFIFDKDDFGVDIGEWVAGEGLKPVAVTIAGNLKNQLSGSWDFDPVWVTGLRTIGQFTRGTVPGFATGYVCIRENYELDDVKVNASEKSDIYTDYTVGVDTYFSHASSGYEEQADEIFIIVRPAIQNTDGDATVHTMMLTGLGEKPAGAP